jgi:predicted DNA-binding protein
MPTSKSKPKQFSLILSEQEKKMLEFVAQKAGRSQANLVRKFINDAWDARGKKRKGKGVDG